jgi:hypothetical protein
MTSCSGYGDCLRQCWCECFDDEEFDIPSAVCTCIHGNKDHQKLIGGGSDCDVWCKSDCIHNCQLVPCHNYQMCGTKLPQWLLYCDSGMCRGCAVTMGKLTFLEDPSECPVCIQEKSNMVKISCGKHALCLDCWRGWTEAKTTVPLTCPFCRESIWKWKEERKLKIINTS